jgi:hypothetical protein
MSGRAVTEIKLAPTRVAVHERGPVQIGQVMPAILERYGLDTPPVRRKLRREIERQAVWLGQNSLAELAEVG